MDGVTYTVSPDYLSNSNGFKDSENIYYKPENPSEAIIYSDFGPIFMGVGIILFVIFAFLIGNVIMKKIGKMTKEDHYDVYYRQKL